MFCFFIRADAPQQRPGFIRRNDVSPAVMKGLIGRGVKCLAWHHWLKMASWRRDRAETKVCKRERKNVHIRGSSAEAFPWFWHSTRDSVFLNVTSSLRQERSSTLTDSEAPQVNLLKHWGTVRMWHAHTYTHSHNIFWGFYSQVLNTRARGDSSLPRTTQTHTNKPVYISKNAQKAHSCLHTSLERKMDTHLNLLLEFPFWKHLLCFSLFSAFLIRIDANLSVLLGGTEQMNSTKSLWAAVMQPLAKEDQRVAQHCLLPVK